MNADQALGSSKGASSTGRSAPAPAPHPFRRKRWGMFRAVARSPATNPSLPAGAGTGHTPGSGRKAVIALFLVALGCRLIFALLLFPYVQEWTGLSPGSDGYEHVAQTLVAGGGYRFAPDLGETMIVLPVYPLFLAGLFLFAGPSLVAAQIAQCVLDAITCLLVYRLGRKPLGTRTAFVGALLYALYPGAWVACSRYLTEPLFVFLSVAFVAAFSAYLLQGRGRYLLAASVCCALAVLCKSVAALLPLFLIGGAMVLPVWRGCRRQVLAGLAACMVMVGCGVGLWVHRNHRLTGSIVYPSTLGGFALYTAHVYAAHPDQRIRRSAHQAASELWQLAEQNGIRLDPRDTYPRWFYSPRDELRLDRLARKIAQERISADRAGFARHLVGNLWRFWWGAPTGHSMVIAALINVPLMLLAAVGFFRSRWWGDPGLSVWLCVSLYFFLTHIAILAVVRYSLTVMPLVCLLAACPLVRWLKSERQMQR